MLGRKKIESFSSYMLERSVFLYLVLMVGVFPFFFRDHYLDIVSAKKDFFQTVTVVFLICVVSFGPVVYIRQIKMKRSWMGMISLTDLCAMLFLLAVSISCVLSPEGSESFWGNEGRRLGGVFLLLCVAVYFAVSRAYKTGGISLWIFLLANCGFWLIIVCNFWGWDLLHMYEDLIEYQHLHFMGTMGNVNIDSGYSGVVTALMMGLYYMGQERLTQGCFFSAVILGTYACYCTRSDSWLLAVGSGLLFLLGISMKEGRLLKWCGIGAAFWAGLALMKLTERLDRLIGWDNMYIQDLREQGVLYMLIDEKVLFACGAVLLLFFWAVKNGHRAERPWKILERYGPWILLAAVAAGTVVVFAVIFPLEDSFGTDRGYIWKRTVWNFREYPFLQKIFGYGPNCFLQSMEKTYGEEMRRSYGDPFIDAHNECLQFLAVTGLLGVLSYMGMQASLFIACLRKKGQQPVLLLGCIGILAYFMQGLVNNPQVFTTPLYFIFMGIMTGLYRKGVYGHA